MSVTVAVLRRGRVVPRSGRRWTMPRWLPATLLFWVAPAVVLTALTVAGQPPLRGDDLIQNYPLRVLAGTLLRHGHLPLWDPYLWSGTPLLAGSNAGALYPATALFAVLPGLAAWIANEVLVIGVAGSGMLLLGRAEGLSRRAGTIAGAAFGYGAYVLGGLEHIGLAEGASLLPLLLLGLRRLRERRRGGAALLAGTTALLLATGEPRAMTLGAVAGIVAGLFLLAEREEGRGRFLGTVVAAVSVGVLLAAVSWLPAYEWAKDSQRYLASFPYFASGSLRAPWLLLEVVPYLLGTDNGVWTNFFGTYNLDQISAYAGLLAVAGAAALLPAARRRPPLRLYYALLVVGTVLALGGYTPVGDVLYHLPVYGRERLQSTNLGLVALALAMFAGAFHDAAVAGAITRRWRRVAAAAVLLPGVGAVTFALAAPGAFPAATGSPYGPPVGHPGYRAYVAVTLLLLATAATLTLGHHRIAPHRRSAALCAFVAADLLLLVAGVGISAATRQQVSSRTPASAAIARLAAGGRFAVYDPWPADNGNRVQVSTPDLNILTGLPSVQGYGSVVSTSYDDATGAHLQGSLLPAALADGVDDQLALTALLAPAAAFLQPVAVPVQPLVATGPFASYPTGGVAQPPVRLVAGHLTRRWIGPPQPVSQLTATVLGGGRVQLGVVRPDGAVRWLATQRSGASVTASVPMTPPRVTRTVGVAVRASAGGELSALQVTTAGGSYAVDGALAAAAIPPHWRYEGTIDGYAAYHNTQADPPLRLAGPAGTAAPGSVSAPADAWWADTVQVSAPRGGRLVRAVAAANGWSAVLTGRGGRRVEPVRADGLVQSVRVPPGDWRVTFRYLPPSVRHGEWLSEAGLLLTAVAGLVAWLRRRRRLVG